ncbi:hypothetical protein Aau02nite_78580 [Amorphoplanes auranticolor]|uniref:Uncharacterized protein n=1 Tax=Actinoplanes auranticolor TaxID=47988 RepID=A0A919W325_9ACTN|nr:hypothetical protein Aau02nite_78580 [Actinoplanes auranticolor]
MLRTFCACTKNAAAQLGHATEQVTKKHYIVKPAIAPDSSNFLEQLGATQVPLAARRGHGQHRDS